MKPAVAATYSLPELQKAAPLESAILWDRPKPRTSQRRALQDLGSLVTLILGGNRSGKSTALSQFIVATALGRKNRSARIWCHMNQIPLTHLPNRPGRVWAVALDSGDSREYVRPNVAKYLPAGCDWRNRDGNGRAEVRIPGGGRILFPSCSEGRDGFQGAHADLIAFDEEPPPNAGEAVVNEGFMRLVSADEHRGRMVFAMTPLRGMTWIYDRWVANTPPDCRVHWIHGPDNPWLDPGNLERMLSQFGPHERAARERGEFTALEGRVYNEFRRDLHVIPSFMPPDDWERVAAIDFGTRNPTAILLGAIDPKDDTLHLLDEVYQAEKTTTENAASYRRMIANHPPVSWFVADPADRGARLSLAREHNIQTIPAKKSVRANINAVAERIAVDASGQPHLFIHDKCIHTIKEIEGYVWATTASKHRDLPDKPKKQNDHCMDCLSYLCAQLTRSTFGVG